MYFRRNHEVIPSQTDSGKGLPNFPTMTQNLNA